jgi:hypothetical protein
MTKRLFGLALIAIFVACAHVDPDTYRPVDDQYSRDDGWYRDSSYNTHLVQDGAVTGTYFDTNGSLVTAGADDVTVGDDLTVGDDVEINGDITMENDAVLSNATNNKVEITENGEDITATFATNSVTLASDTSATFTVTPATTFSGDITATGGAGALTFDGGDETILVKDNDTTALQISAAGATDILIVDSGDDSESVIVNGTTAVEAFKVDTGLSTFDETVTMNAGLEVVSQTIGIPFEIMRVYDDYDALLTNASGDDDDLTFYQGTFGTNASTLESVDCGGLNDTNQYAYFQATLPMSYKAGSTVKLKANAGMRTTQADQSATLDFLCYVADYANADGTMSGDLVETNALSVNSTTFADKEFTIDDDASGYALDAGSVLECRIHVLCDDDGNGGDGITVVINRLDLVIST